MLCVYSPFEEIPKLTPTQGFTLGVSAGAVVFGALLPVLGWVCSDQ